MKFKEVLVIADNRRWGTYELPKNHGAVWTSETENHLLRCFRDGQSLVRTANLLGRKLDAVLERLKRHGLVLGLGESWELSDKGLSEAENWPEDAKARGEFLPYKVRVNPTSLKKEGPEEVRIIGKCEGIPAVEGNLLARAEVVIQGVCEMEPNTFKEKEMEFKTVKVEQVTVINSVNAERYTDEQLLQMMQELVGQRELLDKMEESALRSKHLKLTEESIKRLKDYMATRA